MVSFLCCFLTLEGAFADKVILENGDALTGTVEKVIDGKLTLKTDYSGPIEIQVSKIKKIYTDNPAEVHLSSGEVLKGKIQTKDDGQVIVEKSVERETTSIELPKIASVNPPPPKQWSGSINIGGNMRRATLTKRDRSSNWSEEPTRTDSSPLSLQLFPGRRERPPRETSMVNRIRLFLHQTILRLAPSVAE